jgi:hypothetical protein
LDSAAVAAAARSSASSSAGVTRTGAAAAGAAAIQPVSAAGAAGTTAGAASSAGGVSAGQVADPLHDDSAKAAKEAAQLAALSRVVQKQQDTISRQVSPQLAGQHITYAIASTPLTPALRSCCLHPVNAPVPCRWGSSRGYPASSQTVSGDINSC